MKNSRTQCALEITKPKPHERPDTQISYISLELPSSTCISATRPTTSIYPQTSVDFRPQTTISTPIIHSSPLYRATVKHTGVGKILKTSLKQSATVKNLVTYNPSDPKDAQNEINYRWKTILSSAYLDDSNPLCVKSLKSSVFRQPARTERTQESYYQKPIPHPSLFTERRLDRNKLNGDNSKEQLKTKHFTFEESSSYKSLPPTKLKKLIKYPKIIRPLHYQAENSKIGIKGKSPLTISSISKNLLF